LVDPGVYFLKTQAVDFDVLTRNRTVAFASKPAAAAAGNPDARRCVDRGVVSTSG